MIGDVKDRAASVARGVTYRTVQFGLEHPVAFALVLIGILVALVLFGLTLLTGFWKYLVWAAIAYVVYRLVATGVVQSAIEQMRENPRQYVWMGFAFLAVGIAFPYFVQPQTYVDAQITLSYKLTSAEGWLGFVVAMIDANSLDASVSVVRAYEGAPLVHPTQGVPSFSSEPGDGWWVCVREATAYEKYPEYCWEIPGVNIFVRAVSGDVQSQGYFLKSLPLHSDTGYFVVTVYRDRMPIWTKNIKYVVGSEAMSLSAQR